MNNKEYIQIPKEDFEKKYKTVNKVMKILKRDYNDLKIAYDLLGKQLNNLENILNEKIIKDLIKVKTHIGVVTFSLSFHYVDLKEDVKAILKKAKKEQIDKKQNNNR